MTLSGAVLYAPYDVRAVEREDSRNIEPTYAIIRLSVTCVCGSGLRPYRGVKAINEPAPTPAWNRSSARGPDP